MAAKIFNGVITKWNDPAITAINPGVTLPAAPIKVFFRSDESGTTDNFTKWLHAAAPMDWPAASDKKWTGKGEGKSASAGVATAVKNTEGGLTYAEWSFAKDDKLGIAQIDNGAGPVELTGASVGKSVNAAGPHMGGVQAVLEEALRMVPAVPGRRNRFGQHHPHGGCGALDHGAAHRHCALS